MTFLCKFQVEHHPFMIVRAPGKRAEACPSSSTPCGDEICTCSDNLVDCSDMDLSYVPRLPSSFAEAVAYGGSDACRSISSSTQRRRRMQQKDGSNVNPAKKTLKLSGNAGLAFLTMEMFGVQLVSELEALHLDRTSVAFIDSAIFGSGSKLAQKGSELYLPTDIPTGALVSGTSRRFGNICCTARPVLDGAASLCNFQPASPGIDSIYKKFIDYKKNGNELERFRVSDRVGGYYAESAQSCAQACTERRACVY